MNKIRIVIAEDDLQIAEIQKRFLQRIDNVELVGVAHGLEEAEDLVDVLQPELLLLDIQFPTGTGLDLLRKMRAGGSKVDVVLITAAKEVGTLRAALHGGVFDYIIKPLVFERLKETLDNYQKHLNTLQYMAQFAQSDVDNLMPRGGSTDHQEDVKLAEKRLPKGIDGLTLETVQKVFRSDDRPLSAEDVGELIGASRTTARRYLEYLVSNEELHAEVSYGTVGRPERRYRRIDKEQEIDQ